MRFLIDAQLPPLLSQWLVDQGHTAQHVADIGLAGAEDQVIWMRAVADGAALLTKDQDFVAIRQSAVSGPAVCWLRIGNVANPALLDWFALVLPGILPAIEQGETIIEVR